ncbi:hypothetical protein Sar04_38970 [Salinispora arenicola]|uniref:Polymorphic outer membrane protein n=1 Tax=Salinispora arenicola TaxID=168697 RepID=A0A542XNY0_SALAC|nr:right-handed parallel beta-helix repeat-containing protein [Salinispora arenicola]TQL37568.1 hypothetical protein FB564_2733 [Salinispora arenicola]GIM87161.1 hypothetical protein Sar04_38970 [Salinispora arenicola]
MNQTHKPDRLGGDRARSRQRWWAVGLAGVTGLALTTVGLAASPAADAAERTLTAVDDRGDRYDDKRNNGRTHGDSGKGKAKPNAMGMPVPCDADRLIAAIALANARGGAVLNLAKGCTYLLTADLDGAGLPVITTPITLNGGTSTTIKRDSAAEPFRILTVDAGGDLTLNHVTVTGGQTEGTNNGGGILVNSGGSLAINHSAITHNTGNNGGGVANLGRATVTHSRVSGNTARVSAGGLRNAGRLTVDHSTITGNTANAGVGVGFGGGIGSFAGGVTVINRSSITRNHSVVAGGGIGDFNATTTVTDSTIVGNTAAATGGGVFTEGRLTLRHVDLVGNHASSDGGGGLNIQNILGTSVATIEDSKIANNSTRGVGGGIRNLAATILLRNARVAGNQADNGGGVFNNSTATLTLLSTKVVENTAVTDGGGIFNIVGGTVNLNTATGTTVIRNRPNNCVDVPGCPG